MTKEHHWVRDVLHHVDRESCVEEIRRDSLSENGSEDRHTPHPREIGCLGAWLEPKSLPRPPEKVKQRTVEAADIQDSTECGRGVRRKTLNDILDKVEATLVWVWGDAPLVGGGARVAIQQHLRRRCRLLEPESTRVAAHEPKRLVTQVRLDTRDERRMGMADQTQLARRILAA